MIKNKWTGEEFPVNKCNAAQTLSGQFNSNGAILNSVDLEYHRLIEKILEEGLWKQNRTGVKTLSIFGPQVEFKNVGQKFPLLTQKKIHIRSVIGELLWFLSGSTNKHELKEKYGTSIWDEWDAPNPKFDGDMGPIYGNQWVNWKYFDNEKQEFSSINQLQNIIDTLKSNPDDRRMIVSAWAPHDIHKMALPPCHWSYQFYTNQHPGEEKRRLHLLWNQRSVDTGLGLPFNIASYALLLMMIAQQVDMMPGNIIGNLGDTHIYKNHLEQLLIQLSRESKGSSPIMTIEKQKDLWSYKPEHFHIENYDHHPAIKMPVAV
jgi:thymidylate synthase